MDNRVKYGILVVVGGVGVYLLWKGNYFQQWFPSLFGPSTPATTPTPTGQTPAQIAAAAAAAKAASDAAAAAASGNAAALAAAQKAASVAAAAKAAADAAAAATQAANTAAAAKAAAANQPVTHTCPDIMTWNAAENACVCPLGYLLGATTNTCVPQLVSQQMVTAAGASDGLSMDEWCYEFTAVTGQQCPIDPGSIDPGVYHDAGVQLADGSPGDRSTPTSIQTWLAIMQNQAPSAGLSGLQGLAALRVANAWLV
jgi:hypothetical protein